MFENNIFKNSSEFDKLSWMRLARSANVGAKTFWDLLRFYKTPAAALEKIPQLSSKAGRKTEVIAANLIESEIEKAEKFGAQVICAYEQDYPPLLRKIADAPPVITIMGRRELLLAKGNIAIVGARNASANSCNFAFSMAKQLGEHGYVISSGLAKGIDAAVHKGALSTGTIGVIASGIDLIYPFENKRIYEQLYQGGLVLTEFAFGAAPVAKHFPQRNRIISGLSQAVLVIEAALRSGSLITAHIALDQGREVFAVPGSPLDPRCQGTNSLIKLGTAHLLESADDVIKVLNECENSLLQLLEQTDEQFYNVTEIADSELEKWRNKVIEKLAYHPTALEMLMQQIDVPPAILNRIIIELELSGKAERTYGNKVVLLTN